MIPHFETLKARAGIESAGVIAPGLARIESALERLGRPQDAVRYIHVAGTNGKGSTVAFLEALATAHGWRWCSFTSPAILAVNDQLVCCGRAIEEEALIALLGECAAAGLSGALTDFELLTVCAFLFFQGERPDIAFLEAGMGGREDATNVGAPAVSVIASIALDHTEFLGSSKRAIAYQKAGILRAGRPAVIGPIAADLLPLIQAEQPAPLLRAGADYRLEGDVFSDRSHRFARLRLSLSGEHQQQNAACAIEALLACGFALEEESVRKALQAAYRPFRFERMGEHLVLDGAHNAAGAQALARTAHAEAGGRPLHFVLGALRTKDARGILAPLEEVADRMTFVPFSHPAARSPGELLALCRLPAERKRVAALDLPALTARGELTIACGSLYLLSEIKKIARAQNGAC